MKAKDRRALGQKIALCGAALAAAALVILMQPRDALKVIRGAENAAAYSVLLLDSFLA